MECNKKNAIITSTLKRFLELFMSRGLCFYTSYDNAIHFINSDKYSAARRVFDGFNEHRSENKRYLSAIIFNNIKLLLFCNKYLITKNLISLQQNNKNVSLFLKIKH